MTMTGKIKNLLFDLGGVVISIEREQCVSRLKQLGLRDADDMIGLSKAAPSAPASSTTKCAATSATP